MIRLLAAVFLFVTILPELTLAQGLTALKNGTVADAEVLNQNFSANNDYIDSVEGRVTELEEAIDTLPTPPSNCTTNQIIKWDGSAWVCTRPVPKSSFAFEYTVVPSDVVPSLGQMSIDYGLSAGTNKNDVDAINISTFTSTGINLEDYFSARYAVLDGPGPWVSIKSVSDPGDITYYQVDYSELFVLTFYVLNVEGGFMSTRLNVPFTVGETYIIEFQ